MPKKVSDEEREQMCRKKAAGVRVAMIAEEFGVTPRTVYRLCATKEPVGLPIMGIRATTRSALTGPVFYWRGFWRPLRKKGS